MTTFAAVRRQGLDEGWVAETELEGRMYRRGKIALPSEETRFFSITTVYMDSQDVFAGQYHSHPYSEINRVVHVDDMAELEGMSGWQGAGWTSPGPGSHHFPCVRKGALIALFSCQPDASRTRRPRIYHNESLSDVLPTTEEQLD